MNNQTYLNPNPIVFRKLIIWLCVLIISHCKSVYLSLTIDEIEFTDVLIPDGHFIGNSSQQ